MYHPNSPQVIEGSDIVSLISTKLERVGERVFAHLYVELNPDKTYLDDGHQLHVTNGVNPRLLTATNEKPKASRREAPERQSVAYGSTGIPGRLAGEDEELPAALIAQRYPEQPLREPVITETPEMHAKSLAQERAAQEQRAEIVAESGGNPALGGNAAAGGNPSVAPALSEEERDKRLAADEEETRRERRAAEKRAAKEKEK